MAAQGTNALASPQVDTGLEQSCCLLIHGFNGLATEFDVLVRHLSDRGLACQALQLPGDSGPGPSVAAVQWSDWLDVITGAVRVAKRRYSSVMLIGHSLGAALALRVAADNPDVSAVVALCPPLRMWPSEVRVIRALRYLLPWLLLPTLPADITRERRTCMPDDWHAHAHAYMPLGPLASWFRALPDVRHHLSRVTCPVLVVTARHDHVVPWRDGIEVFACIGSTHKELVVLRCSFHAVLHDVERDRVEQHVEVFCQRLSGYRGTCGTSWTSASSRRAASAT
jgi:carboxylesterase